MKIAVFSSKSYDRHSLELHNAPFGHELTFFEPRLSAETVALARGFPGVCVFVNDRCDATVIEDLARQARPSSPPAAPLQPDRSGGGGPARHPGGAGAGLLTQRGVGIHPGADPDPGAQDPQRPTTGHREFNFEIAGLEGFELRDKTSGRSLRHRQDRSDGDSQSQRLRLPHPGLRQVSPAKPSRRGRPTWTAPPFARESDIITLHCPLTPETHHILNEQTLPYLKDGVFIVNTSRGALLDTDKVIRFKSGKIGYLAIDVYEGGSRLLLQRPVRQGADQRRTGPAVDLSQHARHLAHGLSH